MRSNNNTICAQINSDIHLQFVRLPPPRRIRSKSNRRLITSHPLCHRSRYWPRHRRPPFRDYWKISRHHGRLDHWRSIHCWSGPRPQLWRAVLLPLSHRLILGSYSVQCPWIAVRDVYAKVERACQRHLRSHSFPRSRSRVSFFSCFPNLALDPSQRI